LKKVILAALTSIMVLAMLVPVIAADVAQPELANDTTPELRRALAIKAPDVAGVNQLVTITVFDRNTGETVPRAGVWAVHVKDNSVEPYAALYENNAQFLGWTDRDGNVFHRFKGEGQYVLAAIKDGYIPGFAQITVKPLRALAIRVPEVAGVGEFVTINVVEKYIGAPIPKAGVWAIDVNDIEVEPDNAEDYAALVEKYAQFLDWTDEDGNVFHRFKEPGRYILVALKGNLVPGTAKITIKPLRALAIKAPEVAGVGQLVTITVVEKYLGIPIPQTQVWGINVNDIETDTNDPEYYASLAEKHGDFLGWTNEDGNVFHRFRESGRYVLIAIKDDLVPGFARITILSLQPVEVQPVEVQPMTVKPMTVKPIAMQRVAVQKMVMQPMMVIQETRK